MAESAILSFASGITRSAQDLVHTMQARQMQEPSFDEDAPATLWTDRSPDIDVQKQKIMDMTAGLHSLVSGPYAALRWLSGTHFSSAALRAALEFDVLSHIPHGGVASVAMLSQKTGLDADKLVRMLRLLTTHAITAEVPGQGFKHTAFSQRLANEPDFAAQVMMQLDEMNKASAYTTEYLREKSSCDVSHDSPFSFIHGKAFYDWYDDHDVHAARFARAQAGIEKMARGVGEITVWFHEANLPDGSKIVDVGAGNANLTVALAEQYPKLRFVAQDLHTQFFDEARKQLSPALARRVSFEQHDFFKQQPHNPEVSAYLLRSCLHNWHEKDVVKILQAFGKTLALNPAAKLLINEKVIPQKGSVSLSQEQELRRGDMAMLVIANGQQRSEESWKALVKAADCGLKISRILGTGDEMCVIEVIHAGSE